MTILFIKRGHLCRRTLLTKTSNCYFINTLIPVRLQPRIGIYSLIGNWEHRFIFSIFWLIPSCITKAIPPNQVCSPVAFCNKFPSPVIQNSSSVKTERLFSSLCAAHLSSGNSFSLLRPLIWQLHSFNSFLIYANTYRGVH